MQKEGTHPLPVRLVAFAIYELSVDPHPVNLLQADLEVVQVRLAQRPPMRQGELLQLASHLCQPVKDRA